MEIVPKRSKKKLLPIIHSVVRPGSIVHSDQWAAYNDIQQELGLDHETVNHSLHFVDPATGVHTQTIESYWNRHKRRVKTMQGVKREFLHGYLNEFCWRDRFQDTAFN